MPIISNINVLYKSSLKDILFKDTFFADDDIPDAVKQLLTRYLSVSAIFFVFDIFLLLYKCYKIPGRYSQRVFILPFGILCNRSVSSLLQTHYNAVVVGTSPSLVNKVKRKTIII